MTVLKPEFMAQQSICYAYCIICTCIDDTGNFNHDNQNIAHSYSDYSLEIVFLPQLGKH